jgi:hypothetical protein
MLIAVVQSALATPVPTPEVIEKTFTYAVPVTTPPLVIQAVQFLVMFVAAFAISVAHQITEYVTAKEEGWDPQVNRLLATAYSAAVGLVGTAAMHQLGTSAQQLVALGVSTAIALTGSFWTFEVRKLLAALTGFIKPAPDYEATLPTVTNP